MRRLLLPLLIVLFGCGAPTGEAFDGEPLSEVEMRQFALENPGLKEGCREDLRRHGFGAIAFRDAECFEMLPAQRWSGLWESGWEWTNFCPAPAKDCPIAAERGDIWLELAEGAYKGPDLADGLYEIEFVGRRSKVPGHFGHLNQYDHLMVVDRMISIRLLKAKPQE